MNLIEALYILELEYGFSEQDLKTAYRKMARKYHPDVVGNETSNDKMSQINMAYETCKKHIGKMPNKSDDMFDKIMAKYDKMFEQTFSSVDGVFDRLFKQKFAEMDEMFNNHQR